MEHRTLQLRARAFALIVLFASARGCGGKPFSSSNPGASGAAAGGSSGQLGASGGATNESGGRLASGGNQAPQGGGPEGGDSGIAGAPGAGTSSSGGENSAGRSNGGSTANGGDAANGGSGAVGGIVLPIGGSSGGPPISTDALALWLDAERGVTEAKGAVARWEDQSSSVADATQTTADSRPRRVKASNGRAMIEFDGEDDFLSLADGFDDFSLGLSFFAVVEFLQDSECAAIVELSNGAELDDVNFGRQLAAPHYEVMETYARGIEGSLGVQQLALVGINHSPSSLAELRLNGEFGASAEIALPATIVRYDNLLGRSLYSACPPLHARVGEIVLYRRALPNAERVSVERYLTKKWQQ